MQIYRPAVNNLSSQTRPTTDHPQSPQIPTQNSPGDSRATRGLSENPARNISANSDPNIKLIRWRSRCRNSWLKTAIDIFGASLCWRHSTQLLAVCWHQIKAVFMEIQAQRYGKTGSYDTIRWFGSRLPFFTSHIWYRTYIHLLSNIWTEVHTFLQPYFRKSIIWTIPKDNLIQFNFSPYYHYVSLAKGLQKYEQYYRKSQCET